MELKEAKERLDKLRKMQKECKTMLPGLDEVLEIAFTLQDRITELEHIIGCIHITRKVQIDFDIERLQMQKKKNNKLQLVIDG